MEVSWTTFILEVINFLVLVWILKHFLYKPVLDVIARRRADIDKSVSDAKALESEANAMREQYEGRLDTWEHERQTAMASLNEEIAVQRRQRLQQLDEELSTTKQRADVAARRQLEDARHQLESAALQQGALFASRLLAQGCGPETQRRLLSLLIEDLSSLRTEAISAIRGQYGERNKATATSAYALADEDKARLEQALAPLLPEGTGLDYAVDTDLLAGLRITIGAWQLGTNIQDELRGFAQLSGLEPAPHE